MSVNAQNVRRRIGMKRSPDMEISNRYFQESNNILKKILENKPGVYIYRYKKTSLYVGATSNLFSRGLRIYRKNPQSNRLLKKILDIINPRYIRTIIFFCKSEQLSRKEYLIAKKYNPISQILFSHRSYRKRK